MRKLRWSIPTALALMLVMSVAAFAAPPPPPPPLPPTLLPTAIPQWINTLPRLSTEIPVVTGQTVDISLCEFQTSILPTGTVLAGGPAPAPPLTWVWGYDDTPNCSTTPTVSYVGPVILAQRGLPTQVTYYNNLPDASPFNANGSNVKAYTISTDQTLQWADPFSLDRTGVFLAPPPELNDCNAAVKIPGLLPAPCLNNYGFLAPQPTTNTYLAPVPAAPHLHGGEIPAELDGGPDAWWTPTGIRAHGYYTKDPATTPANAAIYRYPNVQEPAPTWFHDHVLGATRLNVYAGIAGAYYQYDTAFPLPANLDPLGLPNGAAAQANPGVATTELLVPLVIQDRMFDPSGELFFPAAGFNTNPEHPFWVPEFVGDVIVVNGKAWPQLNVEPKRYRFLVLNGSNARSYELFLVNPLNTLAPAPKIWVIGNDQGYLDAPVPIDPAAVTNNKLIIMPGERYEVIIDFGAFPGATFQMRNTAGTPYPAGAPVAVGTTDRIVQFVVGANDPTGCPSTFCAALDPSYDPATLAAIRTPGVNAINRLADPLTGTVAAGVVVDKRRVLTLNEVMGPGGPLEILMNNTTYTGEESAALRAVAGFNDFTNITTQWKATAYSELPVEGQTELWEIVNLTADAHPIHPHLVAFQILNRQVLSKSYTSAYNNAFPSKKYTPGFGPPCDYNNISLGNCAPPKKVPVGYTLPIGGNPDPTFYVKGGVFPPLPAEQGWKDTAISYPGEVLRMLVRFAPTGLPNNTPAANAYYEFSPAEGHGYVWHCHIIDHEDNEMMRPFSVIANTGAPLTRAYVKGIDY